MSHPQITDSPKYALVNRTMTYASVRRPIRLKFSQRLLLRSAPILWLLHCIMRLLSAIRCQSPQSYPFGWPQPCLTSSQNVLWYTFKCTCLSFFIDTFCASLEMRTGPGDSGMTVVEYAFAFAETANLTPTPEVLIAALLSVSGSLVTSHLVALFNWHGYRVRLHLPLMAVDSDNVPWDCNLDVFHLHYRVWSIRSPSEHSPHLSNPIHSHPRVVVYMHFHLIVCDNAHRTTGSANVDFGWWSRCPRFKRRFLCLAFQVGRHRSDISPRSYLPQRERSSKNATNNRC
jgi:hypothetical protein